MKVYADRGFLSLFDHGKRLTLEAMRFERCVFTNCILSKTKDVGLRSVIRDVHLANCEVNRCNVGPAIFEDCSIDGLRIDDLQIIWGALFKHVTLAGDIGKLKINQAVGALAQVPEAQQFFDVARANFYSDIDWALDISAARFKSFDVRGIPARLFRLDLDTQAVITRGRALQPGWQERVSPWNTLWPFMINLFIEDGDEDLVLVAPMGAPKQQRDILLQGLNELRGLGVAEP